MPYNAAMIDVLVVGKNRKRDGTLREWANRATGNYFYGKDGALMVEVKEGNENRHINMATFSGTINVPTGGTIVYNNGQKVTQPVAKPTHDEQGRRLCPACGYPGYDESCHGGHCLRCS